MKKIIVILCALVLSACSSKPSIFIEQKDAKFNTPFINASETSQLDFGLSKEEVLDILGEPLFVLEGVGLTKKITWVYEVRTIVVKYEETDYLNNEAFINIDNKYISSILEVEDADILEDDVAKLVEVYLDLPENSISASNVELKKDVVNIKMTDLTPSKWNKIQKHSKPIHQLALEFVSGGLQNWDEYTPEANENADEANEDVDDFNPKGDFSVINYKGTKIFLSETQANIIEFMYNSRNEYLTHEDIMNASESSENSIMGVFKDTDKVMGDLITRREAMNEYRLNI